MAFVVKDRVKETSTTTGTGTFTLDGAATGFSSFSVIGNGNTTYYTITAGSQWEVGIGIYTSSGTTLSRDTVLASSNNGNLVDFSAGSKDVFVVYPAGRAVIVNGSTVEVPNSAVLPISAGGTGSATATFSGANISGLNASNVSSGVLAVAQGGTGSATASFSGANITSLNASNVSSGVLAVAQGGTGSATASFSGANITSLNANSVSSGILDVLYGGTGSNSATFSGANITSLNASNISTGTIANARTTASSTNGANTIVARDASGGFAAGAITTVSVSGDGSALTSLNASSISSGTIGNAYTTASASNGANTIVTRGANGEFAAGAITGTSFNGSGSNVTSINASNISSGTLAVGQGGTGATSLTLNNVLLGNTTSVVQFVAPGANGNVLTSDGTTWTSAASAAGGFTSGTAMMFVQTAAPTGWTKSTTHNNKALRVVSGAASSGGTVAFTTAFASQAVAGTIANTTATNQAATPGGSVTVSINANGSVGSTTLTTSQIPAHNHGVTDPTHNHTAQSPRGPAGGPSFAGPAFYDYATVSNNLSSRNVANSTGITINNEGGGGSHGHSFTNPTYTGSFSGNSLTVTQNAHNHTFSGTAIDLAVQYVDVIIATKD